MAPQFLIQDPSDKSIDESESQNQRIQDQMRTPPF